MAEKVYNIGLTVDELAHLLDCIELMTTESSGKRGGLQDKLRDIRKGILVKIKTELEIGRLEIKTELEIGRLEKDG